MRARFLTGAALAALCLSFVATFAHADEAIRKSIIAHCRALVGDMGASMVKHCVDEDTAAHEALQHYDERHQPIINRCERLMLSMGGWHMVKYCADEDIEAERALEGYGQIGRIDRPDQTTER